MRPQNKFTLPELDRPASGKRLAHDDQAEGSVAAFYRAQNDKDIAPPAELKPSNAVKQYLDKIPSATEACRYPIT